MHSPWTRSFCLILATILMAVSLPLQSTCEMVAHDDATACATGPGPADSASGPDFPADSSHCGSDCSDCGLPCCVGTAVILSSVPSLVAGAPVPALPWPDCLVGPQVDHAPLGRPPRA